MAANQDGEDYYTRAGDLYQIMADDEQDRLAETIAGGLAQANPRVQAPGLGPRSRRSD
jgi:catalase